MTGPAQCATMDGIPANVVHFRRSAPVAARLRSRFDGSYCNRTSRRTEPRASGLNRSASARAGSRNGCGSSRSTFGRFSFGAVPSLFEPPSPLAHRSMGTSGVRPPDRGEPRAAFRDRAAHAPFARGDCFTDLAWLSQVLGYAAYRSGRGLPRFNLSTRRASPAVSGCLLIGRQRQTRLIWAALLAIVACAWLEWQQFLIVRPQLAGLVCFICAVRLS